VDSDGPSIPVVQAYCDGKRLVVGADEKLTVFVELQRAIHEFGVAIVLRISGPNMCFRSFRKSVLM
jgi:hypothetical protein